MMDGREKMTKLTFPEVEEIVTRDGKLITRGAKEAAAAGMAARKKFSKMAFKVLSQIVHDKGKEDTVKEADKENTKAIPKQESAAKTEKHEQQPDTNRSQKLTAKNVNISARRPSGPVRTRRDSIASTMSVDGKRDDETPRRRGSKPSSFMSLVKLATLKKKISGGPRKKTNSESMENIAEEEDSEELPAHPRFCATLSPEAQYAMLKCYEDVLLDNLQTTKKKEPSGVLYRVKTPRASVQSIQMIGLPLRRTPQALAPLDNAPQPNLSQSLENLTSATPQLPRLPGATPVPSGSQAAPGNRASPSASLRAPLTSHGQPTLSRSYSVSAMTNRSESTLEPIPKDRQLRMSVKFQTAMDILDNLRQENGLIVTSSKPKAIDASPVRNYNMWSKSWSKEFQFEVVASNKRH